MKRVISALLGISVASTMAVGLTGCNGSGGSGSNSLVWICLGEKPADHDAVMEKVNEIVEPELGLKLDIQYIDGASFTEKMKMKMASKESYDLAFTGYVNDYQEAIRMGGLYDITELMENIEMKDGTKVKMSDIIEDYYIESATVNGKVYGIPNIQVISNPPCIQMEKPVAEECGVDLEKLQKLALANTNAETSKEYMDALTAELAKIKEKRPDLYAINPFNPATSNIYEELIGGVGIRKDGTSDEVVVLFDTDENKYGLDTIRKWYELGYIRNDIASTGSTTSTTEEERLYGMAWTTWKPGQDIYFKNKRGVDLAYAFLAEPYVARKQALLTMISVGADSKHPEEAVKLIYMLNSNVELYNLVCWGIEGTHYTKNADGTATEIAGSGYEGIAQNAWRYGNQFNGWVMEGQPADVWEQTEKMNDEARKSPALGFVPNTENINTEISNISNVNAEYKAKISYGTSPRSEYWDEYCKKMETAGIYKVRDEIQKQYDEFLASKN